jgi:hypothetical protein
MNHYCVISVAKHIAAIKHTLFRIIPMELLSVFDTYELEMILYGVPFINVDDWEKNT